MSVQKHKMLWYLRKQNLLQWITFKRRDAIKPEPFFIRKLFHVSAFEYDPNVQGGESIDGHELDGMIKDLGDSYGEDDEDAAELQVEF